MKLVSQVVLCKRRPLVDQQPKQSTTTFIKSSSTTKFGDHYSDVLHAGLGGEAFCCVLFPNPGLRQLLLPPVAHSSGHLLYTSLAAAVFAAPMRSCYSN